MKAVKELRGMKVDALNAKLAELNKEMFRLNGLRASGAVAKIRQGCDKFEEPSHVFTHYFERRRVSND